MRRLTPVILLSSLVVAAAGFVTSAQTAPPTLYEIGPNNRTAKVWTPIAGTPCWGSGGSRLTPTNRAACTPPATTTSTTSTTSTSTTSTTSPLVTTTTAAPSTECSDTDRDRPGGADGFGGCWPDATTTGVPEGTALTVVNGNLTIRTAGAVIDGQDIRGCVVVTAPGVTIKRSKIACQNSYVIDVYAVAGAPLLLEDVEVTCNDSQGTAIGEENVVVRRANVYGCENGFDINKDFTVVDSYVHDLYEGAEGHADGMQLAGGANITITDNAIISPAQSTSAIISNPSLNADVLVARNLVAGGAATIYCPRDSSVNYQLIDNRFSRIIYPLGGAYMPWTDCEKVAVNRGNLWADTLQPL